MKIEWLTKLFSPEELAEPTVYIPFVTTVSEDNREPFDFVMYTDEGCTEPFNEKEPTQDFGVRYAFTPVGMFKPHTRAPFSEVDFYGKFSREHKWWRPSVAEPPFIR